MRDDKRRVNAFLFNHFEERSKISERKSTFSTSRAESMRIGYLIDADVAFSMPDYCFSYYLLY